MADKRPHARHAAREAERRRRRRATILPIAVVVAVVVIGAGIVAFVMSPGGSSDEPPAPGSPEQVALGEAVFSDNCATCHGEGLRGGLAGPPLLDEIYEPSHHPDSAIRTAIAQGVRPHHWDFAAMPPIPGLSDDEVDAVITYIRATQREVWDND